MNVTLKISKNGKNTFPCLKIIYINTYAMEVMAGQSFGWSREARLISLRENGTLRSTGDLPIFRVKT